MALNFPDPAAQTPVNTWSPTSTPSASTNGLTYLWDGAKWTTEGGVPNLHWTRAGSVLSPTNAGDDITTTGDVSAANVVATGDVQAVSLNSGPLAGFRNQLINPNFSVAQRGTSFTGPVNSYTYDRWFVSGNLSVNTTTDTPEVGLTAVELTGGGFLGQGIELVSLGYPFINGSQWTISFFATEAPTKVYANFRDNVGSASNQVVVAEISAFTEVTSQAPANTAYKKYSATFAVSASAVGTNKCLEITFEIPNTTYRLTSIQLEPGPVATPFEHRPIGTELALCQRYFFRTASDKNCALMDGGCSGANTATMTRGLPVTMRANPTLSYVNLTLQPGNLQSASPTTDRSTPDRLSVLWTTAGMTLGNSYWIEAVSGQTGSISADAEL